MRSAAEVREIRRLAALGLGAAPIARRTGIPRSTVRGWLERPVDRPERPARSIDLRALPPGAYAYLLGLYLGDGHVVALGRSLRLSITLDAAYPGIIGEAARAIEAVMPGHAVAVRRRPVDRVVAVSAVSVVWPKLLPQHGPGRKHLRPIHLEPWQRAITSREPRPFIRGLIHSDGSRYRAVVRRRERVYTYTRYSFSNRSDDIKAILCEHLDLLGIRWTRPNDQNIAVARQADVAALDRFVGEKA